MFIGDLNIMIDGAISCPVMAGRKDAVQDRIYNKRFEALRPAKRRYLREAVHQSGECDAPLKGSESNHNVPHAPSLHFPGHSFAHLQKCSTLLA